MGVKVAYFFILSQKNRFLEFMCQIQKICAASSESCLHPNFGNLYFLVFVEYGINNIYERL